MKRRLFALTGTVLTLIATIGVVSNRQLIRDQYVARTASLQSQAVDLEGSLDLTNHAQFIYRASQPQILPAAEFNESCKSVAHEHSIVLGCYTRQQIYVYDVKDERLNGVKEVTAAHELLHALYERLPAGEKANLNRELTQTAESIEDQRFKETLAEYRRTEPDQIENEMHSILGTEIEVLPASLEAHYGKYFKDRKKIVAYAKQYEDAFTSLDEQIADYDQQLQSLKQQKEELESTLATEQQVIESEKSRLDSLRSLGDAREYNQAVPEYNARIQNYNQLVAGLKQTVEDYNQLVVKRNALAATQNDLVKQLDSSYDPLQ